MLLGSLFYWTLNVVTDSDIERDTLAVCIAGMFGLSVGGKRGTSHGRISCVEARGHERIVDHASELEGLRLADDDTHPSVARYRAHMAERAPKIEAWLREVKA